jgi:hypothetical protein
MVFVACAFFFGGIITLHESHASVSAFVVSPRQKTTHHVAHHHDSYFTTTTSTTTVRGPRRQPRATVGTTSWMASPNTAHRSPDSLKQNDDDDDDEEEESLARTELWNLEQDERDDDDAAWISDREKARQRRAQRRIQMATAVLEDDDDNIPPTTASSPRTELVPPSTTNNSPVDTPKDERRPPSPYTDEEEEIIHAMGGRRTTTTTNNTPIRKREPGYLGDSTLQELVYDYSIPICYLADVLCTWGVPIPIHIHDRLGDLVTGEQAFALLEAIYTLDVAALQDRYSNTNLMNLCEEQDIPIKDAFEMAVKEGWSLPFGVQTCLRVEQEEELLRVLGSEVE